MRIQLFKDWGETMVLPIAIHMPDLKSWHLSCSISVTLDAAVFQKF